MALRPRTCTPRRVETNSGSAKSEEGKEDDEEDNPKSENNKTEDAIEASPSDFDAEQIAAKLAELSV
ncbi:hypothetical protein N7527_003792 [Penicillium freii]|nr:hypothetical protein N7527_003792 [Penicillium freii]